MKNRVRTEIIAYHWPRFQNKIEINCNFIKNRLSGACLFYALPKHVVINNSTKCGPNCITNSVECDKFSEGYLADRYKNFAELNKCEEENVDYRIHVRERYANICIIAPHGGKIEPMTSEIANKIAADEFTLYSFEGIKNHSNSDLHITSMNFDEPSALTIISRHSIVVAIHGLRGEQEIVEVGGLDTKLRDEIISNLISSEFNCQNAKAKGCAGVSMDNICNRGNRGKGVQLEISRALRNLLDSDDVSMNTFSASIRQSIINCEAYN